MFLGIFSVTLLLTPVNLPQEYGLSSKCLKGFKKTQKMWVVFNLLLLMSECSDHKPVVPVVGCDNVLKSLNPTAHTHFHREHGSRGNVCICVCIRKLNTYASAYSFLHALYLCGFHFIYIHLLFMCVHNVVCLCLFECWESLPSCRQSGTFRLYVTLWCYAVLHGCKITCFGVCLYQLWHLPHTCSCTNISEI